MIVTIPMYTVIVDYSIKVVPESEFDHINQPQYADAMKPHDQLTRSNLAQKNKKRKINAAFVHNNMSYTKPHPYLSHPVPE